MDLDFSKYAQINILFSNKIDKVALDCLGEPFLNLTELKSLNINISKNEL